MSFDTTYPAAHSSPAGQFWDFFYESNAIFSQSGSTAVAGNPTEYAAAFSLKSPSPSPSSPVPEAIEDDEDKFHEVLSSDTLAGIALRYNVSIRDIQLMNGSSCGPVLLAKRYLRIKKPRQAQIQTQSKRISSQSYKGYNQTAASSDPKRSQKPLIIFD
eukprot:TRINITY_DN9541_c0_g1_i1.p1 TRINITY_DN9541_c0_g1~~TRINITY_DN9541_c0_g1_i1.p1  ORF type:complete len:159 (+),score=43.41 TRINITY_DN9541_c0_g1_i1:45-521(+)